MSANGPPKPWRWNHIERLYMKDGCRIYVRPLADEKFDLYFLGYPVYPDQEGDLEKGKIQAEKLDFVLKRVLTCFKRDDATFHCQRCNAHFFVTEFVAMLEHGTEHTT